MLSSVIRPTLLIDKAKSIANIQRMLSKAKANKATLRPHFKTHQLPEVGEWYRSFGVNGITVSSVKMADKFINAGWTDILIAFPFNIRETNYLNEIAPKASISILIESVKTAEYLKQHLQNTHNFFIKADSGYHRTGILAENTKMINEVLDAAANSEKLTFCGFVTHAGNSYSASSKTELAIAHNTSIKKMKVLKSKYIEQFPNVKISVGDTPTCSIMTDFGEVDELRPGNFVYYDVSQAVLGSCNYKDIAVAVACPVVAKHRYRNELVVYGGAVHLSKDRLIDQRGNDYFGRIVGFTQNGWTEPFEDSYVSSLSQEHGIIRLSGHYFDNFEIGDLIGILPIHSCLTADCIDDYLIINK